MLTRIVTKRHGKFAVDVHGTQVHMPVVDSDRRIQETSVGTVVSVVRFGRFVALSWVRGGGSSAVSELGLDRFAHAIHLSKVNGFRVTDCGARLRLQCQP